MNGLTFYICIGKYGGFGIRPDGPALRIVLGWICICFMLTDIEIILDDVYKLLQQQDKQQYSKSIQPTRQPPQAAQG